LAFLLAREAAGDGLPPEFLASLAPARPWLPTTDALSALGPALAAWEMQARGLSARCTESMLRQLAGLAGEIGSWPGELMLSLDAYDRELESLVAGLETTLSADDLHRRLPRLDARLAVSAAALLERLAIAEAARLHGVGPEVSSEPLAATRIAVGKLREHLAGRVGAVSALGTLASKAPPVDPQEAVRTLALGKAQVCNEHRGLVAEVRRLCDPTTMPEDRRGMLQSLGVGHVVEKEQKAMESALGIATGAPLPAAALLGLSSAEGVGVAMFWERVLFGIADLRAAVERGDAAEVNRAAAAVAARMPVAPPLPPQARGLAEWLAQAPEANRAERALVDQTVVEQELTEMASDMVILARPPAVYPAELRLAQQWQAVWRQRFRLADDPAARGPLTWAVTDVEWSRRKREAAAANVGIGSLQVSADDDLAAVKLPRHIMLELRRAREGTIPELYRDRCHRYMTTILEKAR